MKAGRTFLVALACLVAAVTLAQDSGKAAKSAPKKPAGGAVFMPAGDMKWSQVDPNAPGVMIADLWGNHAKGAFGAINKFPAGWSAPLHTHTHDMKIVVISGTWIHTPEGKPEIRLGPGSYMLQPGGYRHMSACDKASECVCFIESSGAFDMKPVEAAKK
jgi:anti-sigma factor ChrR (cupin superfamily)